MAREATRQISFADVELIRQGVRLEPLLEAISNFLASQHEMIERVRRDLVRGLKKPHLGRRGLTAPQVLRSLVLMRVKNWDYRELRERTADGLALRRFADFYCDPVPKHDAFNRGFNRLTPQTLKAINDLVIQTAGCAHQASPPAPRRRRCWQTARSMTCSGAALNFVDSFFKSATEPRHVAAGAFFALAM